VNRVVLDDPDLGDLVVVGATEVELRVAAGGYLVF
jgi:hypothetical protein